MNDSPLVRFATGAHTSAEQLDEWRRFYGRTMFWYDLEPLSEAPYRWDATVLSLPGFSAAEVKGTSGCYRRKREHINGDDFCLWVCFTEGGGISQLGREASLNPGDAVLTISDQLGVCGIPSGDHSITFRLPFSALAPAIADLDSVLVRPIPAGSAALNMLIGYSRFIRQTETICDPLLQRSLAAHFHDLAALALGANRDATEAARGRGARAARLGLIKADIAANLGRDLSINDLAARHAMSPRSIQMLFESEGTTFSEYMLMQRLGLAYRMLTDPRKSEEKISAIAYDAGFADLSYFNRTFRRRYGQAPSDVRAAALERRTEAAE